MRRFLVTGANKGIGKEVVAALLAVPDAFVYLCARDADRGEAARAELVARDASAAARCEVLRLDVSDPASVAAVAGALAAAGVTLDGLVNNAGVWGAPSETLDTNVWGVHRVNDALLPLLRRDGGRIVHLSSGTAPMFVAKCAPARVAALTKPAPTVAAVLASAREFLDALTAAPADGSAALVALGYPPATGDDPAASPLAYGGSKAFLNLLTLTLAAQLAASPSTAGITVNACSPGFIATDMTRGFFVGKSPAEAGALPTSAATKVLTHLLLGEGGRTNGWYYGSDAKRSPLDRYRSPGDPEYVE